MNKLTKLALVPLVMASLSTTAKAVEWQDTYFELTYFGHAYHLKSYPNKVNNTLNMVGLTFRNEAHGFNVSTFKNSYYRQSVTGSYVKYWDLGNNFEASVNLGLISGYSDNNLLFVTSIGYTKNAYFIPRVSWFGNALMFSMSARF